MSQKDYTRRAFLATASVATLSCASSVRVPPRRRPNILFAIADDWSWPHASIAGDKACLTPAFDRVAREGVLFENAFVSSPSCTPSRGAVLTGQWHWRLEEGGNLHSTLPSKFAIYPDMLEAAGYHVGLTGKGWGPGKFEVGGRTRNPAGPEYANKKSQPPATGMRNTDYAANFADFLDKCPAESPFCFWYGASEPHRAYEEGSGLKAGKRLEDANVPACLPDTPEIRSDILDYAVEVEWFDTHLGRMIVMLEERGQLDNTVIAVTGDNGLPFPRCKSNLYDMGTNVPLAVRWPAVVPGGRVVTDFVSLTDLAPTFLEAAGLEPHGDMTGRSLMNVLASGNSGRVDKSRDHVLTGKERHTPAQIDSMDGYPMRSYRTDEYLYIRNFKPNRWPAGAPDHPISVYRDVDACPTKTYMMDHSDEPGVKPLFDLAFGKRPAEELYDLNKDPGQLNNVADEPTYKKTKQKLAAALMAELEATKDPRALGAGDVFDTYPYYGRKSRAKKKK